MFSMSSAARRFTVPCLAVILASAPCIPVIAADTVATNANATSLNADDSKFVTEALRGGMLEVKAAQLAIDRGVADADKTFAKKLVDDHKEMNDELTALAKKKGAVIPGAIDEKGQKKLDELGKVKDADFAEEWLEEQVSCHKKAVDAYEEASKDAKDADVKAFATKHLPHLQAHLDEAKRLEKQK